MFTSVRKTDDASCEMETSEGKLRVLSAVTNLVRRLLIGQSEKRRERVGLTVRAEGLKIFMLGGMLLLAVAGVRAQQPFVTDDTETVERGKIELEVLNEFDRLHRINYPETFQNETEAMLTFGVGKRVEVAVAVPFLSVYSAEAPRSIGGIGDAEFEVKYNFRKDKEHSYLPAMAVSFILQAPTGNARRGLGSGVTNLGVRYIAQKQIGEKNTVRVNGGYLFAGNTIVGDLGILSVRGHIFTGSASYVRKINDKLQLGGEISGALTSKFQLSEGQLQVRFGGNYQITKKTSIDVAVAAGKFSASPRVALLIGITRDLGSFIPHRRDK